MSSQGDGNAIIKAIRLKMAAMQSSVDELIINKAVIQTLRDTSEDPRVQFNAAKLIQDTELKIAELQLKAEEYENPKTQKIESTVIIPNAIEVKLV